MDYRNRADDVHRQGTIRSAAIVGKDQMQARRCGQQILRGSFVILLSAQYSPETSALS